MLRRKLLLVLGSLVVLLVGVAVTAIWLLQGTLGDMDHIHTQSLATVDDVNELSNTIAVVETELYQLRLGSERHLDILLDTAEGLQPLFDRIGQHYETHFSTDEPYKHLGEQLPNFRHHVSELATAQDADMARRHNQAALSAAVLMNQDVLQISRNIRQHARDEQSDLVRRFRWLVLGLAVAFLLVINLSILLLMRAAAMILRPIDRLVEASRELARERFDYRVELNREDEFDELAKAYNALAAQLQANEQRKIEMLGQVALTLNHELNNDIAIIELQLQLMGKKSGGNTDQEKYLRHIHNSLELMTRTVESLKRVRRIVLTDYVAGVKMLDLQRSTEDDSTMSIDKTGDASKATIE